jgi:hypothetical protein
MHLFIEALVKLNIEPACRQAGIEQGISNFEVLS